VDGGKLAGTGAHSYTRGKIASIGQEHKVKTHNHNGSHSVKPKFRSNPARSVSLA
jgi:hypothetical protein